MLEPLDRRHLFDALRPPVGYDVDLAIGTTYSLDLMALLAVPLAFALFDWEEDDGKVTPNPLALLEATRRYADITHIFCQAGQIHLPRESSPLFYELEHVVKQVRAPRPRGVFHPKVWVLRFASNNRDVPVLYRLLCSSRNLTFDRSWDTILRLDGRVVDRELAIAVNHPLGDFIKALPGMMLRPASDSLSKTMNMVQEEIRRVRFELPEGIEEVRFHPMGVGPGGDWWFDGRIDKFLAMAPFVDEVFLKRAASQIKGKRFLISRLDQLHEVKPEVLDHCNKVYYLHPDADEDNGELSDQDTGTSEVSTAQESDSVESLSGLHAKLFITDSGWYSSVWTGSANATNAAFSRNVEFLIELIGKKSGVGVDAFLAQSKGQTRFPDLLREYPRDEEFVALDKDARDAEEKAKRLQRAIIDLDLMASVTAVDGSTEFSVDLQVTGKTGHRFDDEASSVRCWPVTLTDAQAIDSIGILRGTPLRYPKLSFEALTAFWAFEVRSKSGNRVYALSFVLNLPVEGMPADRAERALRAILRDKQRVLRLLLLLLAETGSDVLSGVSKSGFGSDDEDSDRGTSSFDQMSLLEPMLEMLERNPERLRQVDRLISDLEKSAEGESLLPEGLREVWNPIWAVAQRVLHEQDKSKS